MLGRGKGKKGKDREKGGEGEKDFHELDIPDWACNGQEKYAESLRLKCTKELSPRFAL